MADEHDRPGPRHGADDVVEVLGELGDLVGPAIGSAGKPVPALIIEHHPYIGAVLFLQSRGLEMEGVHGQGESVDEDHGELGVEGADLAHAKRVSVGRGDDLTAVGADVPHRLALVGIVGTQGK